jgi:GTP-binding protein
MSNITYLLSAPNTSILPEDTGAEIAFWGRSNAGKSTLLNALCGNKKLARVSKKPGCTRMMNVFSVGEDKRLVDFPGYGYARVSKKEQNKWLNEMSCYLDTRQSLRGIVLIMDARHPLQANDANVLTSLMDTELPLCLVMNKTDQLKTNALAQQKKCYNNHPALQGDQITLFWLSALKKHNVDTLHALLTDWLAH